jgi:hypothetical protein
MTFSSPLVTISGWFRSSSMSIGAPLAARVHELDLSSRRFSFPAPQQKCERPVSDYPDHEGADDEEGALCDALATATQRYLEAYTNLIDLCKPAASKDIGSAHREFREARRIYELAGKAVEMHRYASPKRPEILALRNPS